MKFRKKTRNFDILIGGILKLVMQLLIVDDHGMKYNYLHLRQMVSSGKLTQSFTLQSTQEAINLK